MYRRTDRQMLIGRPRLHSCSAVKINQNTGAIYILIIPAFNSVAQVEYSLDPEESTSILNDFKNTVAYTKYKSINTKIYYIISPSLCN